jgi:hypothetical protein
MLPRVYADLPKLRARRAEPQLDIARVFAVRKSKSALPVLFCEISARPQARAVPPSGLYLREIHSAGRWTAADQQSYRADAVSEAALTGRHARSRTARKMDGQDAEIGRGAGAERITDIGQAQGLSRGGAWPVGGLVLGVWGAALPSPEGRVRTYRALSLPKACDVRATCAVRTVYGSEDA